MPAPPAVGAVQVTVISLQDGPGAAAGSFTGFTVTGVAPSSSRVDSTSTDEARPLAKAEEVASDPDRRTLDRASKSVF